MREVGGEDDSFGAEVTRSTFYFDDEGISIEEFEVEVEEDFEGVVGIKIVDEDAGLTGVAVPPFADRLGVDVITEFVVDGFGFSGTGRAVIDSDIHGPVTGSIKHVEAGTVNVVTDAECFVTEFIEDFFVIFAGFDGGSD